jgi:hypothetical protein
MGVENVTRGVGDELLRMKRAGHITLEERKAATPAQSLTFPSWVMAGVAGDFAHLYAQYLESPPEFFYFSFLTCLGSFLADRITLASEIRPQPRLYTVLIGESADDRKSTAADKTISFFKETFAEGFNTCFGVGSAEGLQVRLTELEPSRLLLFFDEFKSFIGKCRIDASILLPCVNTLFESNRYESRTKTTSISLNDSYLSLLGCTTKQTFESMWTSAFVDIGFNNRLFLVPGSGERKFAMPRQIPRGLRDEVKMKLAQAVMLVGDHREFEITDEARAMFEKWYLGLEQSIHTKRIDTMALRLMLLLAANEGKDVVDAEIVKKAIVLADWQLEVRKELDPIDADNAVAKMEEKIRRQLRKAPLSTRDLKRGVHANRAGTWTYDNAIKNLQKSREVAWDKKTQTWGLYE